ncbi:MAG: hypothetical protein QOI12_4587 [Alphaproteobacteria bacterium]|nr:hypothetical protein [Alphaproteobacteria bacterium]
MVRSARRTRLEPWAVRIAAPGASVHSTEVSEDAASLAEQRRAVKDYIPGAITAGAHAAFNRLSSSMNSKRNWAASCSGKALLICGKMVR